MIELSFLVDLFAEVQHYTNKEYWDQVSHKETRLFTFVLTSLGSFLNYGIQKIGVKVKINVQRYNDICTIDRNVREFSAFIYKNMQIGNKRKIKHKEIYFDSNVKEMSYLYTNVHTLISDYFGVVQSCGLKGGGKMDFEVGLRYGVKIHHMITLGSRVFIFLIYFTGPPILRI